MYRSRDAYVGGVCAGIADYLDFDHIAIRILALYLIGLTLGLGLIVYFILWAAIPREPEKMLLFDVKPESAESSAFGNVPTEYKLTASTYRGLPILARLAVAAGLMLLFMGVAINLAPMLPGTRWWQFWPVGFLIVGLCLIVIPMRTKREAAWHALGIVVTSLSAGTLPMSLGLVSWETAMRTLSLFWPFVLLGLVVFAMGLYRETDALVLVGAFCIVAFCLLGGVFCSMPGEMETLMLYTPDGRSILLRLGA